jgi:hypothetical protein
MQDYQTDYIEVFSTIIIDVSSTAIATIPTPQNRQHYSLRPVSKASSTYTTQDEPIPIALLSSLPFLMSIIHHATKSQPILLHGSPSRTNPQ